MSITVLLPVYNEHNCIEQTITEARRFVAQHSGFEFVFINDGSTDDSLALIRTAFAAEPNAALRLLHLPTNGGKCAALHAGLATVGTEYVAYMDSDMAYDFEHLLLLRDALTTADIVIGNRNLTENHVRVLARRISGETFNLLARIILGFRFRDTQAGIKGFRTETARFLFAHQQIFNFAFDAELLFVAKKHGFAIGEIPAHVNEDHQTKPSTLNLLSDSWLMFLALWQIRAYDREGKYNL